MNRSNKVVEGGIPVTNPVSGEVVDYIPAMTKMEADRAVEEAGKGFLKWSALPQYERSCILEEFIRLFTPKVPELARLLVLENGKPVTEAEGEFGALKMLTKGYCERANHMYGRTMPEGSREGGGLHDITFTRKEPLGIFVCIIPFNFPVAMFGHKVIPALAAGNSVILKPATSSPLTLMKLTGLLHKAGVPKETVQVVTGYGPDVGDVLAGHPGIQAISMTGSTAAGLRIYERAARNLTRVFLELGANDAFIMLDDADVDLAVEEAVLSRTLNAGQVCCGSKRFLVHHTLADEFEGKLKEALNRIVIGDPLKRSTQMGTLIGQEAADAVRNQVQRTISQGAVCTWGGNRLDRAFFEPTILREVTPEMDVAKDMEIFGPVFPIITFDKDEEALEIANQSSYGLSGAVFSRDVKRAIQMADKLKSGSVVMNGGTDYRTVELAFGGYKKSGIGREGISYTLDEMVQEKNFVLKGVL